MSGVVSLKRIIQNSVLFLIICLAGWSISSAREMLLFVSNLDGLYYCLELQTTGQLVWTGEILTTGTDYSFGFAVSPDQHYIWSNYVDSTSLGVKQYAVTIYGQITATGCSVPLSGTPDDLIFTPNGQLIISDGGPIFSVNPDSSIQTTANEYSGALNISPRGDINYCRGGYPEAFRIDHIDYTSAIITTLEVITTSGYPIGQAIYRPAGDYIAFVYFGGGLEVAPVLPNGMLDTTQVWNYGDGGGLFLDITPDGQNMYANGISHFYWSNLSSMFFDSGVITSVSQPQQIKVSPDGQFLVVVSQIEPSNTEDVIRTFFIEPDGSLVDTGYTFPFTDMFGELIPDDTRLIFVWTPLPTGVPYELWKEFDDK
jgi:hypothetical protein